MDRDEDDWLEGGTDESMSRDIDMDEAAAPSKGEVVTKSRLAVIVGKAPMTIDRMVKDGGPVLSRGSRKMGWRINTAAWVDWMITRAVALATGEADTGMDAAKTRSAEAQARIKEHEAARLDRETILRSEAVTIYMEHVAEFRKRLLEVESQMPDLSVTQRAALRSLIDQAMAEFSGPITDDVDA